MKKIIVCLVIVFLLVSCAPKGKDEMPGRYGDILARLAQGEELTRGEIERIRLLGNQQQMATARVWGLLDQKGDLNADALSGSFSTLPHETGSMYSHNDVVQSVPKTTATTVELQDTTDAPQVQWKEGVNLDFTGNSIKFTNSPAGSIWILSGYVGWGDAITADWQVGFIDSVSTRSITAYQSWNNELVGRPSVVVQTEAQGANWTMGVYHNEAANIDLDTAWFTAVRLR